MELIDIPQIFLSENNPYAHGVIIVLEPADLVLQADPLVYKKSINDRYYTVEQGDTLGLIAYYAYADSREWRRIADANNIMDPFNIQPGTSLLIPDLQTSRVLNGQ